MTSERSPFCSCDLLPWDTAFWGFPVARLNGESLTDDDLKAADSWCAEHAVRCLYYRSPGTDAGSLALLSQFGFRYVDVRVDLAWKLQEQPGAEALIANKDIRAAVHSDLPLLRALASESHKDTRFLKDTLFNPAKAREMYALWLERDFHENHVMVLDYQKATSVVAGYVTCQRSGDAASGRIGLIGVDSQRRGAGVGRELLKAAVSWFLKNRVTNIFVATQATNVPAMRIYETAGFRTHEVSVWFHKWFK